MLLRRLEAYGFKSFAEKTELEFGQGITAIVGPNGSGKSNISDAIRWALGEQSLRTLRGAKMEDVIFAGSANRRQLGVAEVSLVFDNTDGKLPLDFNEVIITRRVFRSGDSEYYINKTACRLKDIHEMLADTGLGRESMTVIGQNKVDEILSSKPEDRRLLFEEASGITKYKQRKNNALRKLEDTEQNLTRVQDITTELEAQLEPLKESADRTAIFNEIHAELIACQATLLLERLEKAEKLVESANLEQLHLTDRSIAVTTRLTSADNQRDALTLKLAEADEKLSYTNNQIAELATESERIDSRSGILTERIEQAAKAEARLAAETARVLDEHTATAARLAERKTDLIDKQRQLEVINRDATEKNLHNQQLMNSISQIELQLEAGQAHSYDHLQQVANERNTLHMLERDAADLAVKLSALDEEYHSYVKQQADISEHQAQLNTNMENYVEQRTKLLAQTEMLQKDKTKLEQTLDNLAQEERQLAGTIQETSSRLTVLSSMQAELEGFGRAIKGILKSQSSWRKGIYGAIAQLIQVPDKYVNAVEVALGGAQQHIVTDTDQTAKQAIALLKAQGLGRATFLPLNTIKVKRPREIELLSASQPGALGFASEVVMADERYQPVVEYLLGRVIIAQTIDDALKIARNSGFSVKIVTLGGELLSPGGSLTGGSLGRKEASFIARNSEIGALKHKLEELKEEQIKFRDQRAVVDDEMFQTNSQYAELSAALREIELRQVELKIHIEKNEIDTARCQSAITAVTKEVAMCQQQAMGFQDKITQCKSAISLLENRETTHKSKVADWQNQLKSMKQQQQSLHEELTDAKIKLSAAEQALISIQSSCSQHEQNLSVLAGQLSRLQVENQQIQTESGQARTELDVLAKSKEKLQNEKHELSEKRQQHYAEKLELLSSSQSLDKEIKELRRQSNELQTRLHEIELLTAKYGYEAANCREQLTGQLDLTMEQARALKQSDSSEDLVKKITNLERQIAALGLINPAAIEEYNKAQERYAFLQEQITDLLEAKAYLATIISDIDTTMSHQFNAAFKAINQYFSNVFVRLFGGGRAELVLIEPGNILETGIDIIVQPPGKKLQNLSLLSGGERALTVIALLFAILTYRPAPFCVVDEIDAALDEANVQRFSEFLQDYAKSTQFIVVTHRKGTMEAAAVLHGVTMEESGISRLVSVKFMDKAG